MKQKRRFETDYERLPLTNDFIFGKVMQNERNCIDMLEILTGNKIESVKTVINQKVIKVTNDSKGIRYDIYVEDQNDIVYDAEMQNKGKNIDVDEEILSKRVRYYQGIMDINLLESGGDYKDLKNSYVIFICTFDPFGLGDCCYEFETVCKNGKLTLKDGRKILFYNTKGVNVNVSEQVASFLRYLETKEACDEYTKRLEKDAESVRMNKEWRVEYMKTYVHDMDVRNEGIQQGLQQGMKQGLQQGLAYSIISILEGYGEIPEQLKRKINDEESIDNLKTWLKYASSSGSVDEFAQMISDENNIG